MSYRQTRNPRQRKVRPVTPASVGKWYCTNHTLTGPCGNLNPVRQSTCGVCGARRVGL